MEQEKVIDIWKDFELIDSKNVYSLSTDEYEIEYDGKTYTIRVTEDDNGIEVLYLCEEGWEEIYGNTGDPIKDSLYLFYEEGGLS